MRALFRNQEDNTLFLAEITFVSYDPVTYILCFHSVDNNEISIPHMLRDEAYRIMRILYDGGRVDVSKDPAYLNSAVPDDGWIAVVQASKAFAGC